MTSPLIGDREPRPRLEDRGHGHDRVVHIFEAPFDRTRPARARCGTVVEPPFYPDGSEVTCEGCRLWMIRRAEALRALEGGEISEGDLYAQLAREGWLEL